MCSHLKIAKYSKQYCTHRLIIVKYIIGCLHDLCLLCEQREYVNLIALGLTGV